MDHVALSRNQEAVSRGLVEKWQTKSSLLVHKDVPFRVDLVFLGLGKQRSITPAGPATVQSSVVLTRIIPVLHLANHP